MRLRAISLSFNTWVTPSSAMGATVPSRIWTIDVRHVELRVNHEIEAAERLVGLVDAMDQVEHLQAEIDDEDVEQVLRDRVHAAHVDRLFARPTSRACKAASRRRCPRPWRRR